MRRALPLLLLLFTGCAHLNVKHALKGMGFVVDTDAVLTVAGRYGLGHACPIGDGSFAITAAHVVDERPFEDVQLMPARWTDASGHSGILIPRRALQTSDLALVVADEGKFPKGYVIASAPPIDGATLFVVGYDWSDRDHAMARKINAVRVLRIVGGSIVLDKDTEPGSSGSCVLNSANEVVGILSWSFSPKTGDTQRVAVAVGVWNGLPDVEQLKEVLSAK